MASSTKNTPTSAVRSNPSSAPAFPLADDESIILIDSRAPEPCARQTTSSTLQSIGYTHTPPLPLLAWLYISLPLIIWDTLYVVLRPHTMPGGKLHSPLWTPYALYGSVDYVYGWPAWNNRNGFTAAQSALNVLESAFYCWYLYVVGLQVVDWNYESIRQLEVKGKGVKLAVLVCFSGAVMTVSKSLLYWLNDAFSGFGNTGHNSLFNFIVIYAIPNGAWIVLPSYMVYVLGKEILEAMSAGGNSKKAT